MLMGFFSTFNVPTELDGFSTVQRRLHNQSRFLYYVTAIFGSTGIVGDDDPTMYLFPFIANYEWE